MTPATGQTERKDSEWAVGKNLKRKDLFKTLEVRHQPTEGLESGSATAPNPRKAHNSIHTGGLRGLVGTPAHCCETSNPAGECDNTPTSDSILDPHLLLNAPIHQKGTRWNTKSRVSDLGRVCRHLTTGSPFLTADRDPTKHARDSGHTGVTCLSPVDLSTLTSAHPDSFLLIFPC